jgi:hypothetical protein
MVPLVGYESFKGRRTPRVGDRIEVYRNLARRIGVWYSIRSDTGEVIGHARRVGLEGAWMRTSPTAAARIAAGEPRTVHAWARGVLTYLPADLSPWYTTAQRVIYRPHESHWFRFADTDEACTFASLVRFDETGMWAKPYTTDSDVRE